MSLMKGLGDFFLSSWIWNITFDWLHPVINTVIMFYLLRFMLRRRRLEALAISVLAQLFAFGLLTAKVVFGFIRMLGWQYEPLQLQEAIGMMHVFVPTLWVGIIYAVFQSLFFGLGRLIRRYNLRRFLVMTWISNGISIGISYMLIRMIEVTYYVG